MKQILKNHTIEFLAEQSTTPEPIKIEVINDLDYTKITTSCGCTNVETNKDFYIITFDQLSNVGWMIKEETQKYFIKKTSFTIHRKDNTKETVNINIVVYDPEQI